MIELDLIQGSQEWIDTRLENFCASEAPMMMGCSKYISRNQLLDHKKGWTTEVNEFTQKLFDAGHKAEAMARPIASKVANSLFYPVVGLLEGTKYLASFDGLTMHEDIIFEHKLYNKVLAENVLNNALEPEYYWQNEHQLMVSGAKKVLFVCSDGTEEKFYSMWYESVPERRAELIAGWEQFEKDLATHQPTAKTESVKAVPIVDLPAISYKMDGLSLTSNLEAFKQAANELVEKANLPIETDQDFANAEAIIKTFTGAEARIKDLIERVVGEVQDIDTFTKDLKFIGEQIRQARLATNKQVQSRKEEIRVGILNAAYDVIREYRDDTEREIKAPLPGSTVSVADAMKGKKNIDSLQNAADTAVAESKIQIEGWAKVARSNIATVNELAEGYKFLFADWKDIAFKAPDDFTALVKTRIADHKETEREKEEAQREQIRKEEAEKLATEAARIKAEEEASAKAKVDAEIRAQQEAKEIAVNESVASQQSSSPNLLIENEKAIQQEVETRTVTGSASRAFIPAETATAIGVGVQGGVTSAPTNHKQGLSPYQQGYIDGLTAGAHYVDGIWCVNTDHRPLADKVQEFLLRSKAA